MDSFAKAFQKGLAKTVAVGQQQLQQRLAKYDQQNTSGSGGVANTYGTGQQAQSQYAYSNQNQGAHQYQNSPAVNQPSAYFPPPPTSSQQHYQSHPQQNSHAFGHEQHGSSPVVNSPGPSITPMYGGPQISTPPSQQHYQLPPQQNSQSYGHEQHGSSPVVNSPGPSITQMYGSPHTSTPPSQQHYQSPPPQNSQPYGHEQHGSSSVAASPAPSTTQAYGSPQTPAQPGYQGHYNYEAQPPPQQPHQIPTSSTSYPQYQEYNHPATAQYRPPEHTVDVGHGQTAQPPIQPPYTPGQQTTNVYTVPPASASSTSYPSPPPPLVNQQQPESQVQSTANTTNHYSSPTNTQDSPAAAPASTQQYHNAATVNASPIVAQTSHGEYGQPVVAQTYSPPVTSNANYRKPVPNTQTPVAAPPTASAQQYHQAAVEIDSAPVTQPSQSEQGLSHVTQTHSLPVTNAPSSSAPPNAQTLPATSSTASPQPYEPYQPVTSQNAANTVNTPKTEDVPVSQPYQPAPLQISTPPVMQGNQNSYGRDNLQTYDSSTQNTTSHWTPPPSTQALPVTSNAALAQQYQPVAPQNTVIQGHQDSYGRDSIQAYNPSTPNTTNHWTPPPASVAQPLPLSPDTAATQHYQPVALQNPNHQAVQTGQNAYGSPDNSQSYNRAPIQLPPPPPPPQTMQNPPAAAYTIPPYIPSPANNTPAQYAQPVIYDPSSIAQQMNNLNINNGQPQQQQQPQNNTRGEFQTAKPKKLPPIRASGEPRDVVRFCSEVRVIKYSIYWYCLPDVPEFLICTKCHEDHIESTPLAKHFERILGEDGSPSTCHFYHPRTKEVLWKQALRSNSIDDFRAFAKRRLTIPNCKGTEVTTGKDGIKYFGMQNNDVNGFIACEACHEDKIIGTSFERNFMPYQNQGAEDKWTCDMAMTYVSRAVEELSKKNDWSGLIDGISRRMQLPVCEGRDGSATEGTWYYFRREMENFHVCGTCYMDRLELTPFENEFEQLSRNGGFDQWMALLGTRWTCNMPSSNLPMLFALEAGITAKDFDGFWNKAQTLNKLVPCTTNGIIGGNWWTLPGGCPDFDICEACYVGVFQTHELAQFLEPAQRNSEDTIVCNFCTASGRFNQFYNKWTETLDRSVFSYYADCVRKYASVLPCPMIHHREKTKWWGYAEALFCEDCWVGFVSDTPLGPHVQFKGEFDERAQICQVWSPRMRGMWMDVCNAGPPGSAASDEELAKFKAFGAQRLQIYVKTVPRIKYINSMKEMKMANAMQQGYLSLMYQGMNSTAVLSGTNDGNLHGSNSLGWYETEDGATAAQMFDNMQTGMSDANRTEDWMEIYRLQEMWTKVE